MTDKQIKQSYDRIPLPAGAERRLQDKLDAELGKPMREMRVVLKPKRRAWIRPMAAAAAVLLLLGVGAWVLRMRSERPAAIRTAASPQEETGENAQHMPVTPDPGRDPEQVYREYYQSVLEDYLMVLSEESDESICSQLGISSIVRDFFGQDPLSRIGYTFADLNGDGILELLIGCVDEEEFYGKMLFDVYYMQEERPKKLVDSTESARWYDCGYGMLMCECSDGPCDIRWMRYSLDPSGQDLSAGLEYQEGIYYDENGDTEQAERFQQVRIYYWHWEEPDGEEGHKGDPMTTGYAEGVLVQNLSRYYHHSFTPFCDYYRDVYGAAPEIPASAGTRGETDAIEPDLQWSEKLLWLLNEISQKEAPFALTEYAARHPDGLDVVSMLDELGRYVDASGLTYLQLRGLLFARENLDGASAEAYAALMKKCYDANCQDFLMAWHDAGEPKLLMNEITGLDDPDSCHTWLYEKWEIWCDQPVSDNGP